MKSPLLFFCCGRAASWVSKHLSKLEEKKKKKKDPRFISCYMGFKRLITNFSKRVFNSEGAIFIHWYLRDEALHRIETNSDAIVFIE